MSRGVSLKIINRVEIKNPCNIIKRQESEIHSFILLARYDLEVRLLCELGKTPKRDYFTRWSQLLSITYFFLDIFFYQVTE